MDKIEQINFYAVKQDLSVVKCNTLDECIFIDDCFYIIEETRGSWFRQDPTLSFYSPELGIRLFNRNKEPFFLSENGWKMLGLEITSTAISRGCSRTLPSMSIADTSGCINTMCAEIEYYEGIIQIHRLLKYISKSPNWQIANERKKGRDLKRIFIRLKNGHPIHRCLYINSDEEYSVELSFKKGIYIMKSCIIEGNPYIDGIYKNEELYENEDFYSFINTVQERFPAIDFKVP